ncbi:MAG: CHAP domain-containing protein [Myxococcota bacterium]
MTLRAGWLVWGLVTTGCVKAQASTAFVQPSQHRAATPEPPFGEQIARVAAYTLKHYPKGFRDDCSGFVEATFARVGLPLRGSTAMLWDVAASKGWTHRQAVPQTGDLAFFDHTYDRNGNGRKDDELSHIAIVLGVTKDGTVHLAHAGTSRGRSRFVMNLVRPYDRHDGRGHRINDALRRRGENGSADGTLASELLRGFASVPRP